MSESVITVENLSKCYILGHQKAEQYGSLRDAVAEQARNLSRRLLPFGRKSEVDGTREEFWALKEVSFEVKAGDRIGILGRNGAGKSTLLKVLSRITEPTTGRIRIRGRVASLLEVGTGFHPELTGRENIYLNGAILGMSRQEIKRKFDEIVDFAEVEKFLDTPVKRYSSGMYVRLAFAVAAHLEPEILIVDEVLAVGDAQFQKKCLGKMSDVAQQGRTVLFVSHNMAAIANLCTSGVLLDAGRVVETSSLNEAIGLYMQAQSSHTTFQGDGVLTKASVAQEGGTVVISVNYQLDHRIAIPCLGFVISDDLGRPICGTNPIVDNISHFPSDTRSGNIKAVISYPQLLNGTYNLSLWFGDGRQEFFSAQDCLTFDVVNMASLKQLPASSVGPVYPQCAWHFDNN